jgi:hypothetical protein
MPEMKEMRAMNQESTKPKIVNEEISLILGKEPSFGWSWINFPRYINEFLIQRLISPTQYFIYAYLRNECGAYSSCKTSIVNIRYLFGNRLSANTINKALHSLRNHMLLTYADRKGVAGPFEVKFPDFFIPGGKITSSSHGINPRPNPYKSIAKEGTESQVSTYVGSTNHTLMGPDKGSLTTNNNMHKCEPLLGNNNDKEKDMDKDKYTVPVSSKGNKYKSKVPCIGFIPNTYEEGRALEIARAVGDIHLDWYLALIKKGRFWALEDGYGELEEEKYIDDVENLPGYLNAIVQRLIKEREVL